MWIVGEDMPQETNRVTLDPVAKDKCVEGIPVASVHFGTITPTMPPVMRGITLRSRGKAIYARAKAVVGATNVFPTPPYPSTHNMGIEPDGGECDGDGVVNAQRANASETSKNLSSCRMDRSLRPAARRTRTR